MHIHKNIRLLAWHNFFTDFRPYAPLAVIYFAEVTGSYALGLSIFSIEMLSAAIFEVPTGVVSDMLGRKRTIVLGSLMAVFSLLFYAIGIHYLFLAVGGIFAGLARSFYSGNNTALLHDSLQENDQVEAYAEYSGQTASMFQFALAASALLGGIVVAYVSFSAVMWLSIIPQVLCLIISLQIRESKVHDISDTTNIYSHIREAILKFKENARLRTLSLASIIDYAVGETTYQFSSAFIAQLWPVWAIGVAKMLSNICAALGMRISGYITKRYGFFVSLMGSCLYSRIIGLLAVLFPTFISPALIASMSFPYGISTIAKDALLQKEFTDKQRATMGSLNSLAGSLLFAVFAFVFGFVADRLSAGQALFIGEILLIVIPVFYWSLFKK